MAERHSTWARAPREALREKGQFWTPDWVALAMMAYALQGGADHVFDPAVGEGAFFRAAKAVTPIVRRPIQLIGVEKFPETLERAQSQDLTSADLANVQIADFITSPPQGPFAAITANPPYIRHHRLPVEMKAYLKGLARDVVGEALDGRAGLHVFFLIRSLALLSPNGRLSFIMPADTAEGVFASVLWKWISENFRVDVVVTFAPEATPFPGVDTNPIVFMIRKAPPLPRLHWLRCEARGAALFQWVLQPSAPHPTGIRVIERSLDEALATGLSRPPVEHPPGSLPLSALARVVRGIATGANDFFFLTREDATRLGIPGEFLVTAVGRTRDIEGDSVTEEDVGELEAQGRPTLLLSVGSRPLGALPPRLREYLLDGEARGLPSRALIASRRPWYKMEHRSPPPFLFAYLGRRRARFIRNLAGVVPLTGFLCVYPHQDDPLYVEKLWDVLSHPDTVANLPFVAKSYGGGALKVEPRSLEKLTIPAHVLAEASLPIPEARLTLL